jgi:hypothetical protein
LTSEFLLAAVTQRPSPIAGRGVFTVAELAADRPAWRGDPADCPFNHSCAPTLWWSGGVLVTCRAVPTGEELTVDYSTCTADPSFLLACHCESYGCRQMVTGDDWRIPQLQRRYAGHWAPALQRLLDEAASGADDL